MSRALAGLVLVASVCAAAWSADGAIAVLDGDIATVSATDADPAQRAAILMRWSEMAQRLGTGTYDQATTTRTWQRMAPALEAVARRGATQPDASEAERGLQLALAVLAQCTAAQDAAVQRAAIACVQAAEVRLDGERRTALWVIDKLGLRERPEARAFASRCLREAGNGKDAEIVLRLYPQDPEILAAVQDWCAATPIGQWETDRQRLAFRAGIPAAQRADALANAVEAVAKPQDGYQHLWLAFLVLHDAAAYGGALTHEQADRLRPLLATGFPLQRRVAAWLLLLETAPRGAWSIPQLTGFIVACGADGAPAENGPADRPIDRLHDVLLLAWLPEAARAPEVAKAAAAALAALKGDGAGPKLAATRAALLSLAQAGSRDRVARLDELTGSFTAGTLNAAPFAQERGSAYGQALFATVPAAHEVGQPPAQLLERLAQMKALRARARNVLQVWALFPEWSQGVAEALALLQAGDAQVTATTVSGVAQLHRQGLLRRPLAPALRDALRAVATATPQADAAAVAALEVLAPEASGDPALIELVLRHVVVPEAGHGWSDWVDALARLAPDHPRLGEIRSGILAHRPHPLTLWLFDAALLGKRDAPMPSLAGVTRAPELPDIAKKLARYARTLADRLANRDGGWLVDDAAVGLDRLEDRPALDGVLTLLGAVDAAAYHREAVGP